MSRLTSPNVGGVVSSELAFDEFAKALDTRRRSVYDYLENWPGAESFRPAEIHDALFSYVRRRGKALRPALLLLCCGAVGGDEAQAIPAAAAIEIYHIWTLVHDDIIDRDETRRGHPTVHAQYAREARKGLGLSQQEAAHYGQAVGILAGDLQQSWSFGLLAGLLGMGVSAEIIIKLIQTMANSLTPKLLEGEMLDVQFALSPPESLTDTAILHMLSCKTAALLEYAAWAGATIGLGKRQDEDDLAAKLGRFAYLCGIAFQLQDDVLGLTADESLLGKPVGSDLREGKRTLIVQRALFNLNESDRRSLRATLGNEHASREEVEALIEVIRRSGAIEEITKLANSYISQALAILESLPAGENKRLLRTWATFTLSRKY